METPAPPGPALLLPFPRAVGRGLKTPLGFVRVPTYMVVHCFAESLLRLVCKVFNCDMASCTLLTGDAYHIVVGTGVLLPGICPDRWGFCAWSFLNSNHELLVVEDLKKDVR